MHNILLNTRYYWHIIIKDKVNNAKPLGTNEDVAKSIKNIY